MERPAGEKGRFKEVDVLLEHIMMDVGEGMFECGLV